MNTSRLLDSKVHDWAPPWCIKRPSRKKPLPGHALDVWHEERLLFRAAGQLRAVLDRIDPVIAYNEPVAELVEDAVMCSILELIDPEGQVRSGEEQESRRLPQATARIFLSYFVRGFRAYCQTHRLRFPRLPLTSEFSLDDGLLNAQSISALDDYRRCVQGLSSAVQKWLSEQWSPSPAEIAALIVGSAALFGGLPRVVQWDALTAALARPPSTDGTILWYLLDGSAPMRWIADPVTEALIRRLWYANMLPLSSQVTSNWRTLQAVLQMDSHRESVTARLETVVRAAHLRHFAPDVAAVAQGIIRNTPMQEEPWLRMITGARHRSDRARVGLSAPRTHRIASPQTIEETRLAELIGSVGEAVRWNPDAERAAGKVVQGGSAAKRYSSRARSKLNRCEQMLCDMFSHAGAPGGHLRTYAYGLISYARDLLEIGGQKRKELAPSTVSNYVSIVRVHLKALWYRDLVALPIEDREDAYRDAVRAQATARRDAYRTAFEGFERSLLRNLEIADEVDWGSIKGRAIQRELPPADANFIDPVLYRHVFESLSSSSGAEPLLVLCRILLIVLYRFGLRTGEAAELTVGSVFFEDDCTVTIRVTKSQLTTRKSSNALRSVGPIRLPADEYRSLLDYYRWREEGAPSRKRERSATYLFSTPGADCLDLVLSAQKTLVDVLREVAGDCNLRARHFRHSFVSRLYVTGREGPYRLNNDELGAVVDQWRRTYLVGHAAPDTSIVSYTHTNEFAHYHYVLCVVENEASRGLLSRLTDNAPRSLERAALRAGDEGSITELFLNSMRRNFPLTNLPSACEHRKPYPPIDVGPSVQTAVMQVNRMDWESAWTIYASARVGKPSYDLGTHAVNIQAKVRALTNEGKVQQRQKRRPQLTKLEKAAVAHLWEQDLNDSVFQSLIGSAIEWILPSADRINLRAEVAEELAVRLRGAGLLNIRTEPGVRGRRRLLYQTDEKVKCNDLAELLAFLYCGVFH